jgi:hypothetical protein
MVSPSARQPETPKGSPDGGLATAVAIGWLDRVRDTHAAELRADDALERMLADFEGGTDVN